MLRLRAMEVLPLKGLPLLIASALLLDAPRAVPQSLDVALGGYGLSFGNSKRITGVRVNLVDDDAGRAVATGIYVYRMRAREAQRTRKLLLR